MNKTSYDFTMISPIKKAPTGGSPESALVSK